MLIVKVLYIVSFQQKHERQNIHIYNYRFAHSHLIRAKNKKKQS